MQRTLLNVIFIVLISVCYSNANTTESSTATCRKCSPCWNIFGKNYGPCSEGEFTINPFSGVQPVCIDAFILLIIIFVGILVLIPTCLWLFSLWVRRCRKIDGKYVVNERIIN
ncbi:unnamed protein product [Rotaria magnacalcarata]|uniref:Uncharacterized protein n=1 Tax=Rotaria magnacalcarata TaxID=392030 RepID=A0A814QV23_9BILA|nr:unnamed protein product [Rotaria magnacalcarata]CAF1514373.1 unnamed protein product [Rotaria magnacalcarata]CAF1938273.1 unnamed protein product [Rotaria magnacalcarata]CAF2052687.1 unnamed protein product [Rotaria magnacalcarata]CAF2142606.1 unnamed protein product [Rotaria magnacalcarata]